MTDEQVIHIGAMVLGAEQAWERFEQARRDAVDPTSSYFALFEVLNWVTALDERQDLRRQDRPDLLRGIRYARNVIHHQWADALEITRTGFSMPIESPVTNFEWRWRQLDRLPSPPSRHCRVEDRAAYSDLLAGTPARVGLRTAVLHFATAVEVA